VELRRSISPEVGQARKFGAHHGGFNEALSDKEAEA
jgi:hypothetical protein